MLSRRFPGTAYFSVKSLRRLPLEKKRYVTVLQSKKKSCSPSDLLRVGPTFWVVDNMAPLKNLSVDYWFEIVASIHIYFLDKLFQSYSCLAVAFLERGWQRKQHLQGCDLKIVTHETCRTWWHSGQTFLVKIVYVTILSIVVRCEKR